MNHISIEIPSVSTGPGSRIEKAFGNEKGLFMMRAIHFTMTLPAAQPEF